MSERLQLTFQDASGAKSTLTVVNPKGDLTESQVRAAMEDIISKNIFQTKGGDLLSITGAKLISTETTELIGK